MLLIAVVSILAVATSDTNICFKYGYDKSILDINLEWVIQGYNIGFQGFFVELLGIAGSLSNLLPQSRLVKSSFKNAFDEPLFPNKEIFLNKELFQTEMVNIVSLASSIQTSPISVPPNANKFGASEDFCQSELTYEHEYIYEGSELSKSEHHGIQTAHDCCELCFLNPLCLAWSLNVHVCSLKGKMELNGFAREGAVSGRMIAKILTDQQVAVQADSTSTLEVQVRRRHPAPRVIVFHGTTCIHRNQSVSMHNRDIDTILIGRYMLERPFLVGGYNLDEYAVLHCAARMDELWVPTEWHKAVFLRLLTQQGSASSVPLISVIPEAVDTNLFDPSFVRTGTARSIVDLDRLLLVDGSRLENTTAPLDTVVVSRSCGFSGHQVICNSGKFEFLTVFKWEYRKGWDVLLDAYWAAFQPTDQVVLRVRSYVPLTSGGDRNITRLIEKHALSTLGVPLSELATVVWENGVQGYTTSRACFSEDVSDAFSACELDAAMLGSGESDAPPKETHLTREDMRDLLASASAFVLATRGEGWGLPVAEAMSMALPVIVTNHSGPAAFATEKNAYLIPILPDLDQLSFAQPNVAALVDILRQVVFDSAEEGGYVAQAKGRAGRDTMKEISPDSIVCKMNERIRYHARMRGWLF